MDSQSPLWGEEIKVLEPATAKDESGSGIRESGPRVLRSGAAPVDLGRGVGAIDGRVASGRRGGRVVDSRSVCGYTGALGGYHTEAPPGSPPTLTADGEEETTQG